MPNLREATLSTVLTMLNWLGEIPREKILGLLRKLRGTLRNSFFSFRAFIIRNYFKLNLFALLYAVAGVPILLTAFPNFPPIFHQSLAIIAIVVPVMSTDLFWRPTAQENPSVYVRGLRVKSVSLIMFFALFFALMLSLPFIGLFIFLKNTTLIIHSTAIFAVLTEMFVGLSVLTFTLTGLELPTIAIGRIKKIVFRTNATAYFTVIANGNNLEKDISNFKEGIDWVNEYLKAKFKLGLLKMQDYCNFFKLIALSRNEEEKNRIREALSDFAHRLNAEMDLTDTIMAIREIIGKPLFRFEDVTNELDFKVGFRERLYKRRALIAFIVSVASLIIAAVQFFAPFIADFFNSLSNSSLPEAAVALILR